MPVSFRLLENLGEVFGLRVGFAGNRKAEGSSPGKAVTKKLILRGAVFLSSQRRRVTSPHPETDRLEAKQLRMCLWVRSQKGGPAVFCP